MNDLKRQILIQLGNNIRKWRQLQNIKQESVADELEITKVSISKMETGKSDISITRLYELAKVLGVDVSMLLIDPRKLLNNTSFENINLDYTRIKLLVNKPKLKE
jgi:transcriptional regulator with XRE-family HTH domain